jgi:membrane-bound ClpP family serine protease
MSEEDTFWISLGQRFFGLLLLIIGVIMIYFTVTSIAELAAFSFFFGFLSVVLLVIGIALLIARSPE